MLRRRRGVGLDRLGHRHRLRLRRGGSGLGHRLLGLRQDHRCRPAALGPPLHRVDAFDLDPRGAGLGIAELLRRGEGQVDDPVGIERAAVVDADDHALAVVQVGHPHIARQRQGLVRGGHAVEVVGLAVGGGLAVELGAVPGRGADHPVGPRIVHRVVGLAQHGVGVGLHRTVVRHRHRIGDPRHVDVPPGGAVAMRTGIVARPGNARLPGRLLGRLAGATAQQHGRQPEAADGGQDQGGADTLAQWAPRARAISPAS